ncbi:MAG TPA: carboxypeptidase regulatory-like domain-containing protein [Terriglobales bacterium]
MRLRLTLAFLLCGAVSLAAQTFRGTILGSVTDISGAVLSGASVAARNTATGQQRTTQTSGDGSYSIPELPIGTYEVTASQAGFQTWVTRVDVTVASERRVDAQLKPGSVTEKVEVSADLLPQVETTSDTLGTTYIASTIKDLPVNGRDYQKLIFLTPGISGSPDQITDSPGSFGIFSMNGARGRSNNFLLDGTDMNDGYRNDPAINEAGVFGTPATILPVDAIAELRVLSNFEPEYGRNAGAVINIVTKSGTNKLHGSLIEYFRNNALDARNFFNFKGQPQATFQNNQFGGSLGGPIAKNKTFFFVNYEGQREKVGVVTLACVPDPTQIAADAAAIPGGINPVIAALLARNPWPKPNIAGAVADDTGCHGTPNASLTSPSKNRVDSMIAKIDHNFNAANILTGRYYFGDSQQSFPLALTAGGGQLPGFNTDTPTRVQLVSVSFVRVISPTKVNELRFGWNRFVEDFLAQDRAFKPSSIGLNVGTGIPDQGLPIMVVSGFSQLGANQGDPRGRVDQNYQLLDNFSWKHNSHDVKFGAEFRRTTVSQFFDRYSRGKLTFDNLSDFLSGTIDGGFQYLGNTRRNTYQNGIGFFIQDGWRVTPHFTFNYGMRWDYFGVVGEKNNLLSNITSTDLAAGTVTLTQVGSAGLKELYRPDYRNFAPRASFAWDVTGKGKTVVRGGIGMFYDAFSQDFFLGHLPYPPFFAPGPAYNPIGPSQVIAFPAVSSIAAGAPVYDATTPCLPECDIFSVARNVRTPYMENYNINIQQQLANKVTLQVGYVGSQGHRLFRFRDINQPSQAAITASDLANGGVVTDAYSVPRPFGNNPYGAFYILQQETTAKSNYNALQTSLRVNGWHGVTSILNYVWSRSFDTASDGEDFEPNAAQPNDSTRPNLEYGPSNFDVPHRFTWIFGYELPKQGGSAQWLKNGWGMNSTLTLQSGQPFQLNYNFQDDFSGSGEGFDRPDVVGPIVFHRSNPFNYLDMSAFAIPCTILPSVVAAAAPTGSAADCVPGTRHFGNMGRNSLRGPAYRDWQLGIYKNFNLSEHAVLQLKVEIYNVLNHPNFASPFLPNFIADAGQTGNYGLKGNREVTTGGFVLGATGDVGVGNPFLGGGGPRGIQLAAKITF